MKLNYFTATKKPIGWSEYTSGRGKWIYDAPATPYQRLLASRTITKTQQDKLQAIYICSNPAQLARQINTYQDLLISLVKNKINTLTASINQKN